MSDRNMLKAYLELKETHILLHRTLKAIEEDCEQADILRRARATRSKLDQAIAKIGQEEP